MKILFCQGAQKLPNGNLLKVKKLTTPGLTLPYLAALTPKEHEVEIRNEAIQDINFDGDYDLIGITTMGGSVSRTLELADEFRKRGKTVIIGGIPITNSPEFAEGHVDCIVKGEIELIWEDILEDFSKGQLKPFYQADQSCDMKDLPIPRYDLFDKTKIGSMMPVHATRGCSQTCTYCSLTPVYEGKFRTRPVEDVIRDIKAIKALGFNNVGFVDDNLVANKKFAKQLFKEMIPLKMRWWSQGSLTSLGDEEFVQLMADSGCFMLSIGFETIDPVALKSINKRSNVIESYEKKIKLLKKFGVHVHAFLMFGFDSHDIHTFDATYNYFMDVGVSLPDLFILVPPPGTPMFDEFETEGRLLHKDWDRYRSTEVVFEPKQMTIDELKEGYWQTYGRFYSYPSIFKRLLKNRTKGFLSNLFMLKMNIDFRKSVKRRVHTPTF